MDEGIEDQPALPRGKTELIERIERSRAALDEALAGMSDAQLVARSESDAFSVKDHIAHLAAWERGIVALLHREPRYGAMGVDEQTYLSASNADDINTVLFERAKDLTLAEVLDDLRQTQRALLAALAPLSDADLAKTYSHYQPDEPGEDSGAPIVRWIAGNTYEHYAEHAEWIGSLMG
jgi:hypothetical protein